jgi:hypothetical protein
MSFGFRKRFTLGPFTLNLSKRGLSGGAKLGPVSTTAAQPVYTQPVEVAQVGDGHPMWACTQHRLARSDKRLGLSDQARRSGCISHARVCRVALHHSGESLPPILGEDRRRDLVWMTPIFASMSWSIWTSRDDWIEIPLLGLDIDGKSAAAYNADAIISILQDPQFVIVGDLRRSRHSKTFAYFNGLAYRIYCHRVTSVVPPI